MTTLRYQLWRGEKEAVVSQSNSLLLSLLNAKKGGYRLLDTQTQLCFIPWAPAFQREKQIELLAQEVFKKVKPEDFCS